MGPEEDALDVAVVKMVVLVLLLFNLSRMATFFRPINKYSCLKVVVKRGLHPKVPLLVRRNVPRKI